MSTAHDNREQIIDALKRAEIKRQLGITRIDVWPTTPHENPTITVTTADADGYAAETTITLESDGDGIYTISGPRADIRDSLRRITEKAIA